MFCPSCGSEANDQTKYCTKCGVNFSDVLHAMIKDKTHGGEANDWWRGQIEFIRQAIESRKKPPEEKRLSEIKGGVITSCVGLGLMIFLYFLCDAIVSASHDPDIIILRAIPYVGVIPFLIGIGITFNGLVISKRLVELKQERERDKMQPLFSSVSETAPVQRLSEAPQTPVADFSVTEPTTTKLREPASTSTSRDTN
ncbi:MAG: DUF6249 domain-containing protein [Acidobacteria bacterium]|nr:DUF6249 domain-containing protein [Acidobacteriota bacterium]MCI0660996.1 DUF6249 domain-containing protein [Acidobacteriota bacterium]